jgi:hypothetical protein
MIDSLLVDDPAADTIEKSPIELGKQPATDASETIGDRHEQSSGFVCRHRVLLPRVISALADTEGYLVGLKRLSEELKSQGPTQFWRFYYEEILARSPETAELARKPISSPVDAICAMLRSDEFMQKHDIVLQREFPQLTRDIFLHVPKSGGTTIFHAFESDDRFCSLHVFPNPHWFADRLGYLRKTIIRLLNPKARYVCLWDHPPAIRFMQNRLKRGWDNAFMILRDPIDASVSWINYVLTQVATNASTHGDAASWRRELNVPETADAKDRGAAVRLIPKIVELFVPSNAICTMLGREPSLESALETAAILDLKIIRIEQADEYIRYRGITGYRRMNESVRFVEFSDLDRQTQFALYDKNGEDLKFCAWASRHAVAGEGPWVTL